MLFDMDMIVLLSLFFLFCLSCFLCSVMIILKVYCRMFLMGLKL